jgi:endonuclease/exonuclease/phosphatase family metal-dependent hydrolase
LPLLAAGVLCCAAAARALDITTGDYSKNNPNHIRVMTWNVFQHLGDPGEPNTPWTGAQIGSAVAAINLIVAALDPDILLLQECGDIPTSPSYTTVLSTLQSWRNANRPGFAVHVGNEGGSIHCAILSRWPFASINGDGISTHHDMPSLLAGPGGDWPQGGDGGTRGWVQGEINLPDASYLGNLYVGCSHFEAGGTAGEEALRVRAAKNIAAYIQYALNLGTDPLNIIPDASQPPQALAANTPVVWGGDFNTALGTNPVDILRSHNPAVGTDGTDRDGGDAWRSDSATAYNGTTATHSGGSRLDWILCQDSIAPVNATFIFDTNRIPRIGATMHVDKTPPNMIGLLNNYLISQVASDHFPVVADIAVPVPVVLSSVQISGPGAVDSGQTAPYTAQATYSDSSTQDVTTLGAWSVLSGPATISPAGLLSAGPAAFDSPAQIRFSYTSGSVTAEDTHDLTIVAICDRGGDVDGNGVVDSGDIARFVAVVVGAETDPLTVCRANMDANMSVDELDGDLLVDSVLNQ